MGEETSYTSLQKQLGEMNLTLYQVRSENVNLQNLFEKKEETIQMLMLRIMELQQSDTALKTTLKATVESFDKERIDLEVQISSGKEEIETLRGGLESCVLQKLSFEEEKSQEIEFLENRSSCLDATMTKLVETVKEWKIMCSDLKEGLEWKEKEILKLKDELDEAKTKLKTTEVELKSTRQSEEALREKFEQIQMKFHWLEERLQGEQASQSETKLNLELIQLRHEELMLQLTREKDNSEELKKKLHVLDKKFRKQSYRVKYLEDEVNSLKGENIRLEEEKNQLKETILQVQNSSVQYEAKYSQSLASETERYYLESRNRDQLIESLQGTLKKKTAEEKKTRSSLHLLSHVRAFLHQHIEQEELESFQWNKNVQRKHSNESTVSNEKEELVTIMEKDFVMRSVKFLVEQKGVLRKSLDKEKRQFHKFKQAVQDSPRAIDSSVSHPMEECESNPCHSEVSCLRAMMGLLVSSYLLLCQRILQLAEEKRIHSIVRFQPEQFSSVTLSPVQFNSSPRQCRRFRISVYCVMASHRLEKRKFGFPRQRALSVDHFKSIAFICIGRKRIETRNSRSENDKESLTLMAEKSLNKLLLSTWNALQEQAA